MPLRQFLGRSCLPLVLVLAVAACSPVEAIEPPSSPSTAVNPDMHTQNEPGLAVTPTGGADLYDTLDGSIIQTAQEGLIFPITTTGSGWHRVVTTCGGAAWVPDRSVDVVNRAESLPPGVGFDMSRAVIVIDPGHGGRDLGGRGARGVWESPINLVVAEALRNRLESSTSIDWNTGRIAPGSDYPAIDQVWMTRRPEGPLRGDVELSLRYRAEMANRSGADALVSIHNNTGPETTSTTPGSDVFYSVGNTDSDRLASLIHEELIRSLSPLLDEWSSGLVSGPRARVDPASGEDFYGILRRSEPPAVIVEGMYVSDPDEEAILDTASGQQLYADAVYRGLVRFLTTDDYGSEINDPEDFDSDVGSATYSSCVVPEQPGS